MFAAAMPCHAMFAAACQVVHAMFECCSFAFETLFSEDALDSCIQAVA